MNHTRRSYIKRRAVVPVLLFACFCPACNRTKPSQTDSPAASAAPAATSAPMVAPPVASAPPGSACTGKYQGQYTVTAVKSELARKEGAPEKWESDDGQALAGTGELTLEVDAQNVITGSTKGALGQLTLRGLCDEKTLRAQLDNASDSVEQIQNAFLVAELAGDQVSGTVSAATGDSLIRRTGTVTLRKAQ